MIDVPSTVTAAMVVPRHSLSELPLEMGNQLLPRVTQEGLPRPAVLGLAQRHANPGRHCAMDTAVTRCLSVSTFIGGLALNDLRPLKVFFEI